MADVPDEKKRKAKQKAERLKQAREDRKRTKEQTPEQDAREADKRRNLKQKAKSVGKSIAGTVASGAKTAAKKGAKTGKKAAKKGAKKVKEADPEAPEGMDDDRGEARQSVFQQGKQDVDDRLGAQAPAFLQQANEFEPQAPQGQGSEGENPAAAVTTLLGAGFGDQGDPPMLVGVDTNRDGQFQRDEIALFGPPQTEQRQQQSSRQQTKPQSEPQPRVPMGGSGGPDPSMFPDFGGQEQSESGQEQQTGLRVPGFMGRNDGALVADPYVDGFVSRNGPQF